jgi:hypothetical protein
MIRRSVSDHSEEQMLVATRAHPRLPQRASLSRLLRGPDEIQRLPARCGKKAAEVGSAVGPDASFVRVPPYGLESRFRVAFHCSVYRVSLLPVRLERKRCTT